MGQHMADTRKLRDEALKAVERGNWKKAVECYGTLERLEPLDGTWPLKAGEAHKRLGKKADAIAALGRAADLYSKSGLLVKAIAACKLILELDPNQTDAQTKLASFHSARGVPVTHSSTLPLPAARGTATAERRPEGARGPATAAGPVAAASGSWRTLGDLPLEKLVPTRPGGAVVAAAPGDSDVFEFDLGGEDTVVDAVVVIDDGLAAAELAARAAFPKTPLFSGLSERHLGMLITGARLVQLETGQTLFSQGDVGDSLYVIVSGEIAVFAPTEVARLGEGAFLGEIALIVDQPRSATAKATRNTELLCIDRTTVAALVADSPEVLSVLLRFFRDRLVSTLVETSPLFKPFSVSERATLASKFLFLQINPGVVMIQQGQRSPGLFVLAAGGAQIELDGKILKMLAPGDVFGEISLITHGPATATVRAIARSFILEMPRHDFAEVILTHPQVLVYLDSLADSRKKEIGRLRMI